MSKNEKLKNFNLYWKLVNIIDDLCTDFLQKKNIYLDDILSALDRVKTHIITESMEAKIEDEKEENISVIKKKKKRIRTNARKID